MSGWSETRNDVAMAIAAGTRPMRPNNTITRRRTPSPSSTGSIAPLYEGAPPCSSQPSESVTRHAFCARLRARGSALAVTITAFVVLHQRKPRTREPK